MKHLDLFTGILGFAYAAKQVWRDEYQLIACCEKDKFCQDLIRKRALGVPIFDDIRTLTKDCINEPIDLITGGFPCQPYSIAGKRKGAKDDRAIWPEMLRVVEEIKPRWVVAENVANIRNMGIDLFISDLEDRGYFTETFDISADAVGLPTMERHIWIIATTNGKRFERQQKEQAQGIKKLQKQLPGSYQRIPRKWNLPETRVCGVGERVPHRMDRLRALGNAIVPQVAMQIFEAIRLHEINRAI